MSNATEQVRVSARLSRGDTALIAVYGVLAVGALVGTQWTLITQLARGGSMGDAGRDLFATPASTFSAVDLVVVALVAVVFMVVESRRLGMRRLWVYIVLTFVVAISVAFPLFLIERQVHRARVSAP
ncbi:DUF2834 domain-containing protein [Nocardia sp. NPDC059240]|uniref:DUF2834 domain-containing protein n=1 Tax=Nocardia sp. NPDC059240 TaxID=3346786 RepID=UPI0036AEF4B2